MKFENILNQINQKVSLTEEESKLIISKLKNKTFAKGEYIFQAGEVCKFQTFIISGKVRTFYLDDNGNEHIISFGIEDWWVGDICSFTTQAPAEYSSQSLDATEVCQISFDDMELLYREVPKLERFFRIMIQSAYGGMSKRIIRNHAMSAKERYLLFLETYPQIVNRVPQYMVASYLGITKEFLSAIRKQIASE